MVLQDQRSSLDPEHAIYNFVWLLWKPQWCSYQAGWAGVPAEHDWAEGSRPEEQSSSLIEERISPEPRQLCSGKHITVQCDHLPGRTGRRSECQLFCLFICLFFKSHVLSCLLWAVGLWWAHGPVHGQVDMRPRHLLASRKCLQPHPRVQGWRTCYSSLWPLVSHTLVWQEAALEWTAGVDVKHWLSTKASWQ